MNRPSSWEECQRGAGYSEPRLCPDLTGDPDSAAGDTAIRECLEWMRANGFDRTAYTTTMSAYDLIDLRKALGYERWDIQGESYGTRLAQEAMRLDAQAIRSVTLVAPSPTGSAHQLEAPLSHQNALNKVFAACEADPNCRAAFPDPRSDYFETFEALVREPLRVPPSGTSAATDTVLVTAALFRNRMKQLISAGTVGRIPLILREFQRGDRLTAARAILPAPRSSEAAPVSRVALTNLILCYDEYFVGWAAASAAINAKVHPSLRTTATYKDCEVWLERLADPSHAEPVRSDIPTLLVVGELDEITPPEHARRIASTLPNAYVFEFPGLGHGPDTRASGRSCNSSDATRRDAPTDCASPRCRRSRSRRAGSPQRGPHSAFQNRVSRKHEDHDGSLRPQPNMLAESAKSGLRWVDGGVARSRSQVCRSRWPDRTRRLRAPGQLTELAGKQLHPSLQCGPATEDGFATHLRQPNRQLASFEAIARKTHFRRSVSRMPIWLKTQNTRQLRVLRDFVIRGCRLRATTCPSSA